MSGSSVLERLGAKGAAGTPGEPEGTEDYGAFGLLRGVRDRAIMLELRKKDGNVLAVSYGWIDQIELDPSQGIILHCGSREILISGRNLNTEIRAQVRLFQSLTRHRVPWIQEMDEAAAMKARDGDIVVDGIKW